MKIKNILLGLLKNLDIALVYLIPVVWTAIIIIQNPAEGLGALVAIMLSLGVSFLVLLFAIGRSIFTKNYKRLFWFSPAILFYLYFIITMIFG